MSGGGCRGLGCALPSWSPHEAHRAAGKRWRLLLGHSAGTPTCRGQRQRTAHTPVSSLPFTPECPGDREIRRTGTGMGIRVSVSSSKTLGYTAERHTKLGTAGGWTAQ